MQNQPLKILFVDDDPNFLVLFKDILKETEFQILVASGVDEAIAIIKQESDRLALVISDFHMRGQTGFDLRRQMLTDFKQVPFILCSGQVSREYALEAIELKISAFISKPFNTKELVQSVAEQSKDRVAAIKEDDELLEGFVAEAELLIGEMEELILRLEAEPENRELLNRIFACAHTIKGTSGYFKPDTVFRFTHKYEDFLARLKKAELRLDASAIGILLQGLDTLKTLLQKLAIRSKDAVVLDDLTAIFERPSQTAEVPAEPAVQVAKKPAQEVQGGDEVRIGIDRLDDFMEQSGHITVLRNMVNKAFQAVDVRHSSDANVAILGALLQEMQKSIGSVQEEISDLRKIPASHIVKPLFRALRDLCVSLGKQIRLEVQGEDVRVDYGLADTLSKSLIHLLRNSADHGLENPEGRQKSGKPGQGVISLSFVENSAEVIVTLKDDGRGIDTGVIKAKALAQNLVSPQEMEAKSEAEILTLIFAPGFSTAEKVTDVSGRGVGMDMVNQLVLKTGGRIEMKSQLGIGTEFAIHLPLPKSVLIINSLMVRWQSQIYSIPQDQILRVMELKSLSPAALQRIGEKSFYRDESGLNPIIKMSELLKSENESEKSDGGFLIKVNGGDCGTYCLEVEEIMGIEDIVVKTIAPWFHNLKVYKGATFLGDGRIGLILDVNGIGEMNGLKHFKKNGSAKIQGKGQELQKRQYLMLRLGHRNLVAIPQDEIARVESIRHEDLHNSGGHKVTALHGRVLTLIHLHSLLYGAPSAQPSSEATLYVILKTKSTSAIGYGIEAVEDLVELEVLGNEQEEPLRIVDERVVQILSAEALLQKYLNPSLDVAV